MELSLDNFLGKLDFFVLLEKDWDGIGLVEVVTIVFVCYCQEKVKSVFVALTAQDKDWDALWIKNQKTWPAFAFKISPD